MPSHILLGIAGGPDGVGRAALRACGVDCERMRDELVRRMPDWPRFRLLEGDQLPLSTLAKRIVDEAIEEAHRLNQNWVGTEHLLLALCAKPSDPIALRVLRKFKVTRDGVREFVVVNAASWDGASA